MDHKSEKEAQPSTWKGEESGRKLATAAGVRGERGGGLFQGRETWELKGEVFSSGQDSFIIFLGDIYCLYIELLLLSHPHL